MTRSVGHTNNADGQKFGFFPFVGVARLFLFAVRDPAIISVINLCFMFNVLPLWHCSATDSLPDQVPLCLEDAIPIDVPLDSGFPLSNPLQSFFLAFPGSRRRHPLRRLEELIVYILDSMDQSFPKSTWQMWFVSGGSLFDCEGRFRCICLDWDDW